MDRTATAVRVICILGAVTFIGAGAWAMIDPQSFFDNLATYPPYNEHLLHDIGAFQIGLGAGLVAALMRHTGVQVALIAAGVGSAFHALAHFMDTELGGKSTDPWMIATLAVLLLLPLAFLKGDRREGLDSRS